jgi:hypothetical protein
MSTHDLKPGDRVRLTPRNHMQGYQPGEKGVVLRELLREMLRACSSLISINGERCYCVAMDTANPMVIFTTSEIEPDV